MTSSKTLANSLVSGLCVCVSSLTAAAATIAIDVGHYRERPGVISARGRPEFEFNLDLAHALAAALEARGYATRLIGADGGMRDLWRRPRAAGKADLFISVHHDSTQLKHQMTWTHEGAERNYSDRFAVRRDHVAGLGGLGMRHLFAPRLATGGRMDNPRGGIMTGAWMQMF